MGEGGRRKAVPDRGRGEVRGRWEHRVPREGGRSGKDTWVPDRVGRDRSGSKRAGVGEAVCSGGEGKRGNREAVGVLLRWRRRGGGEHQRSEEGGIEETA